MKVIGLLGFFLLLSCPAESSLLDPVIENVRHIKATHHPDKVSGMWKKKMLWKPRWVKEWKSSNVLKPVWKKFWGPVIIREWVPIPKPPPQWDGALVGPAEPPAPNLIYLSKSPTPSSYPPKKLSPHGSNVQESFSSGSTTTYKAPYLPITSGFRSQAETYSRQPSYGSNFDSSAYDLNPPVEQFNSRYSYANPSGNRDAYHAASPLPIKSGVSHSHIHNNNHQNHRHYHHRVKSNGHTHLSSNADLTKFPPDWNSWNSAVHKPHPHSSGLAQASSAVSIVSKVQSTTPRPTEAVGENLLSQGLLPADDGFIQQAALVSEYHYTEHATQNPPSASFADSALLLPYVPNPADSHDHNGTVSHVPVPGHLSNSAYPSPSKPIPVQSKSPSNPSLNSHSIPPHGPYSETHGRPPLSSAPSLQTLPVQPPTIPPTSHIAKVAFLHVPTSVPSQKPTSVPPVGSRPANIKFSSSSSFHGPVPVTSLRPAPVHPRAPSVTEAHASASPRGPPLVRHGHTVPVRAHIPPQAAPGNKNLASSRKPGPATFASLNNIPPVQENSQLPKKNGAAKSEVPKDNKMHLSKQEAPKVPDFKALPSASVEAFHFIEAFPSNQTLNKASLIGNIHQAAAEENQVEIIPAKPHQKEVPLYVTKLAQAIVNEHLKKAEKGKPQSSAEQTTRETPTERTIVTLVYPSTNPFVRKTLKAYLAEEDNAEKSMKVFVVTPVPQEVLNSTDVSSGV